MKLFYSNNFAIAGEKLGVIITSVTDENKIERLKLNILQTRLIIQFLILMKVQLVFAPTFYRRFEVRKWGEFVKPIFIVEDRGDLKVLPLIIQNNL